jgi:hypothetical protein
VGGLYHRLEEEECSLNQIKTHLSTNDFDSQIALMAIRWLVREYKISLNRESNAKNLFSYAYISSCCFVYDSTTG